MYKLFSLLFWALFFIPVIIQGQGKILSGVVRIAGQPAIGVKVYTGFDERVTDDLGRYALNLSGCTSCTPGRRITVNTYKKGWGMTQQVCVIDNEYRFDFSIKRNPEKLFVVGVVLNEATKEPLNGITVKIIGLDDEEDISTCKTNEFGEFKIPISKEILENKNALRIQAKDEDFFYVPIYQEAPLIEFMSFNIIGMRKR